MSRGIIAIPAIVTIQDATRFTINRVLTPLEVRYYILYWDRVVIPTSGAFNLAIPDNDILIQSGVVERPRVEVGFPGFFGGEGGYAFVQAQAIVAKRLLEQDHSTDWVLHQIGNELVLPSEFKDQRKTLRFELVNLLPVPNGDVPIPDIIEFKDRRKDELEALHIAINETYLEAIKCPDESLGTSQAIRNLTVSIQNFHTVSRETWKLTPNFDFSIELNLDGGEIAKNIAAGAAFDYFSNIFTLPIGQIVGIAASIIKLKAKLKPSFKPAENNSKLAYLSEASNERII